MATYTVRVLANGNLTVLGRMKQGEEWLTIEAAGLTSKEDAARAANIMATEFANIRAEARKGRQQLHLPTMEDV